MSRQSRQFELFPEDSVLSGYEPPTNWLEGAMAILHPDGEILEINEAFAEWLRCPAQELCGSELWPLLEQQFPDQTKLLKTIRRQTEPFGHLNLRRTEGPNETLHWYRFELARHPQGVFVRLNSWLPPMEDMIEEGWNNRLHSEAARREMFLRLLRTEAQLDNLTRHWPGVIFSQRTDLTFRFASPRIEQLTGISVADWQEQTHLFWQLVHESDIENLQQQLKHAVQSPQGVTSTYRIRQAHTGRIVYILEHRQAIKSQNGLLLGYEGFWLDITRQTIAEKRLSSAAWKETLAVLTMGLAHDLTNVMAGIHSLSEAFLPQMEEDHPFKEGLGLIKRNSLQASELVHRIINLHRGKVGENSYHDLNQILADVVDLAHKIVPRRIEIQTEYSEQSLPLHIDAVEFRQVLINLVLNAVDAMSQNGRLTLTTAALDEVPPSKELHGKLARLPAACVSIRDTGSGIKPRHLANIFDPFFTTKPINKGSGLGLYNARLFVEKHHGAICVESEENVGTTFQLWLPQVDFEDSNHLLPGMDAGAQDVNPPPRRSLLLSGHPGKLLEGTAEFFRSHGYHVVTALSKEIAVECLNSGDYQFAALMVVTDPEDHGLLALLSQATQILPSLKVVLKLSGFEDQLQTRHRKQVDLIIPSDLAPTEILNQLKATIDPKT